MARRKRATNTRTETKGNKREKKYDVVSQHKNYIDNWKTYLQQIRKSKCVPFNVALEQTMKENIMPWKVIQQCLGSPPRPYFHFRLYFVILQIFAAPIKLESSQQPTQVSHYMRHFKSKACFSVKSILRGIRYNVVWRKLPFLFVCL